VTSTEGECEEVAVTSTEVEGDEVAANSTDALRATDDFRATDKFVEPPNRREMLSIPSIVNAVLEINAHSIACTSQIQFESIINISMCASVNFQCECGWTVAMKSDSGNEQYPINKAVALASAAIPLGFSDMHKQFVILENSAPTHYYFNDSRSRAHIEINQTMQNSMKEAAEEEKRLAIEADEYVTSGGIKYPFIVVAVDGSWAKRTYGHSYNSDYGAAVIIGVRTKKVLFVKVQARACYMCTRNKNRKTAVKHTCYKNFEGPSTAMESDGILEGFKKSIEMYGLVYLKMVADGDCSTFKKVEKVYQDVTVTKVECTNHVIRNLNSKLRDIAANQVKRKSVEISKEERSIPGMQARFRRIGKAVQSACIYYKNRNDWDNDWKLLAKDIRNIPFHIFGRHTNCSSYFKCSLKDAEEDLVDVVKPKPMFQELVLALDRVASLSNSLIRRENTNIVESFMSVIAKYLEGKRKNPGGKFGYNLSVASAVLSFNKSSFWVPGVYRFTKNSTPSARWKLEQRIQLKRRMRKSVRTKPRALDFAFLKAGKGDANYGTNPDRPDVTEAQLEEQMSSVREKIAVDESKQKLIELQTRGQSENPLWAEERKFRITASIAKKVFSLQDSTSNECILRLILCPSRLDGVAAIEYGRKHEKDAIRAYELAHGTVNECGLIVSVKNPCLAVSPDSLIGRDGLLEVKCPLSLKEMTLQDWAQKATSPIQLLDGVLVMKKTHEHYFQVLMQLYITGRQFCDYFIWSSRGEYFLERVSKSPANDAPWKKLKTKLVHFWENDVLPELADSRLERKLKPRIPQYRLDAMKARQEKLAPKKLNSRDTPEAS